MAGEDNGSRTEEATPRRLEEARKEGDVAKSMELAQVCALAGAFGVVAVGGGYLARNLAERLVPFLAHADSIELHGAAGGQLAWRIMGAGAPALRRRAQLGRERGARSRDADPERVEDEDLGGRHRGGGQVLEARRDDVLGEPLGGERRCARNAGAQNTPAALKPAMSRSP